MKFRLSHILVCVLLLPIVLPIVLFVGAITWKFLQGPYRWDRPQDMKVIMQVYSENSDKWAAQVKDTPTIDGEPKFIILKYLDVYEEAAPEYIVYDESDKITDVYDLHLPFWKQRIKNIEKGSIDIDVIAAKKIDGHIYWMRTISTGNTYALLKTYDTYEIIQLNCSKMSKPVMRICPDQIKYGSSGEIQINYDFVKR